MQIQKINFLPRSHNGLVLPSADKTHDYKELDYTPVSYGDYNILFKARLFRTPQNFYAQPFNKNGMPDTMKEYLNADYEDRQKMPPAQMLKLVFDDIKETKNLEQVKRLYYDEPLFKNLTDTPNRKARTGILAEIDLMKEDGKSLFKNGNDNLGHYILKKIYTEAKTLKEINTDFKKDISVYYKDLSPIGYDTLAAYGIKFPNNAFWKSLTATREEFPYKYKPRNPLKTDRQLAVHTVRQNVNTEEKKRFEKVKDWEIDKLADSLIKGNGNSEETAKHIKKTGISDKGALTFVAKYMSEINSVVLEKLHVSPEMSEFFENYEGLSKSQKQILDDYWKNPETKELRSKVMKSTIKFFFDVYGTDGQNEEFQELLEYAHNIKPKRIEQMKEHNRIQEEYNNLFAQADLDESEIADNEIEPSTQKNEKISLEEAIKQAKEKYNVETYKFSTDEGEIVILANLRESLGDDFREQMKFLPKSFTEKFIKFLNNSEDIDDKYILTKLLSDKNITLPKDDRLEDINTAEEKTIRLYKKFNDANKNDAMALQQSLSEFYMKFMHDSAGRLFFLNPFEFVKLYSLHGEDVQKLILNNAGVINDKYNSYKRPLTDSEARIITLKILDMLRNYDPTKSTANQYKNFEGINTVFYSLSKYLNNKQFRNKEDFRKDLTAYLKLYGGSARFLLKKDVSKDILNAKMEHILCSFTMDQPEKVFVCAAIDAEGINYIKRYSPKTFDYINENIINKLPFDIRSVFKI